MTELLTELLKFGVSGLLAVLLWIEKTGSRADRQAQSQAWSAMFDAQASKYSALADKFVRVVELQINELGKRSDNGDSA